MDGKEIAYERRRRGLSQRALAGKVGVSESTVGNWETGRSSPGRSLAILADVFAAIPPRADAVIRERSTTDGRLLSAEDLDGLLGAMRDIRESADKAVKLLGG